MAWDLGHGASISVLVLLSVSVFLTLCLIVIAMCFSRRASGNNFELQERGEGQGGHSEPQIHEVDDPGESQGSRLEHRGQEDHPDIQDHQGQDGHQSRAGHRNNDNLSRGGRNNLTTFDELVEAGFRSMVLIDQDRTLPEGHVLGTF